MNMTTYRRRTEKDWRAMRDRFHREWDDAFSTMECHQFRITTNNGVHGGLQVSNWFHAHGRRMVDERWPEFKEETA